jgi:hypothetical protein
MSIFYINAEKTADGQEFTDKYDLAKFIDGSSDVPDDTKKRIKIVTNQEIT